MEAISSNLKQHKISKGDLFVLRAKWKDLEKNHIIKLKSNQ